MRIFYIVITLFIIIMVAVSTVLAKGTEPISSKGSIKSPLIVVTPILAAFNSRAKSYPSGQFHDIGTATPYVTPDSLATPNPFATPIGTHPQYYYGQMVNIYATSSILNARGGDCAKLIPDNPNLKGNDPRIQSCIAVGLASVPVSNLTALLIIGIPIGIILLILILGAIMS